MLKKLPMLAMRFDFTATAPWNPLQTFNPEEGFYVAQIADVEQNYNNGKSTKFTLDLIEGPSIGQTDLYLGNEPGEKGGNKRKWLQALCAVAPDPEKFLANLRANPSLDFDPVAAFKGKRICVMVQSVPGVDDKGRPNLPNKEFITRAQYDQAKTSGAKPGGGNARANGASAPAGTPTAAQPGPAAPTAPQGDVLGKLFG